MAGWWSTTDADREQGRGLVSRLGGMLADMPGDAWRGAQNAGNGLWGALANAGDAFINPEGPIAPEPLGRTVNLGGGAWGGPPPGQVGNRTNTGGFSGESGYGPIQPRSLTNSPLQRQFNWGGGQDESQLQSTNALLRALSGR